MTAIRVICTHDTHPKPSGIGDIQTARRASDATQIHDASFSNTSKVQLIQCIQRTLTFSIPKRTTTDTGTTTLFAFNTRIAIDQVCALCILP